MKTKKNQPVLTDADRISRRELARKLGALGAGAFDDGASSAGFVFGGALGGGQASQLSGNPPKLAFRGNGLEPAFLLSIFLRGGADGLTLLAPALDADYKASRTETQVWDPTDPMAEAGKIGIKLTSAVPGHPDFTVPQALAPLHALFTAPSSELAFFHACGNADTAQSHFEAQKLMDFGTSNSAASPLSTGWLARHLASKTDHLSGPANFRAISYSSSLALNLAGAPGATPVANPAAYGFPISYAASPEQMALRSATLEFLYDRFGEPLDSAMESVLEAVATLEGVTFGNYMPGGNAMYPPGMFGGDLKRVAQLAKEVSKLEAVHIDLGGWDTHEAQGVHASGGRMFDQMEQLAGAVRAFYDDMSAQTARRFIVVIVTEFGRTVQENSSAGTDHGRGGVSAVLGSGVIGGQVYGAWPGLGPGQQVGGDLAVTTDVRDIFGEVAERALKNPTPTAVVPTEPGLYQYNPIGFLG